MGSSELTSIVIFPNYFSSFNSSNLYYISIIGLNNYASSLLLELISSLV